MKIIQNLELGASLRCLEKDGKPWFVAKDVCDALGILQTSPALSRLDEDEKGVNLIHTLGGMQQMAIVSESGLYALILRSDKPAAKVFRKWVTSEVLPQIRQTGGFSAEAAMLEACRNRCELARQELNEATEALGIVRMAAARKIANDLGVGQELETLIQKVPAPFELPAPKVHKRRAGRQWKLDYQLIAEAMPGAMPSAACRQWLQKTYGITADAATQRMQRMIKIGVLTRKNSIYSA